MAVIAFEKVEIYCFLFATWLHVTTWSQGHVTLLVVVPQLNLPVCQVWWPYNLIFNVRRGIRMIILLESVTMQSLTYFVLQRAAKKFYYKVWQVFITECVRYYKVWQFYKVGRNTFDLKLFSTCGTQKNSTHFTFKDFFVGWNFILCNKHHYLGFKCGWKSEEFGNALKMSKPQFHN